MQTAILAIVLSCGFHIAAAVLTARHDASRREPAKPLRRVRRLRTAGWVLSLVGAMNLGGMYWQSQPWLATAIAIAVLLVTNGLPSLVVAAVYQSSPQRA